MRKRFGPLAYVLLALFVIGFGNEVVYGSRTLLIPIILVAIVFLLYKFPPSRVRTRSDASRYRHAAKNQARQRKQTDKARTRTATFRVIEGSKPRDDEPPTYH